MPTRLSADLLKFTEAVHHLDTPEAVMDALDGITWADCRVHVLGAALLPLNFGTSDSLVEGKTVFLHKSVPKGWWEDRTQLATRSPAPSDVAARLALAPFTLSELMKSFEPIGIDRWAVELNLNMASAIFSDAQSEAVGFLPIGRQSQCSSSRINAHCST